MTTRTFYNARNSRTTSRVFGPLGLRRGILYPVARSNQRAARVETQFGLVDPARNAPAAERDFDLPARVVCGRFYVVKLPQNLFADLVDFARHGRARAVRQQARIRAEVEEAAA